MEVAEARQARHALVQPGIVLHRAGAERKQPRVDAVIHLAEADVVPHRLRFGEARSPIGVAPLKPAQAWL
jgi:hypothetical protein